MNKSALEKQVKKNSTILDAKINTLVKTHKNKYAILHEGKHFIAKTFSEGIKLGIEKFGDKTGFAVKKITKEIPVLSSLVKL